MKTKSNIALAGLLACFLLFFACKHELPISGIDDSSGSGKDSTGAIANGGACSADSVYFTNEIQPLIVSSCAQSGCHNATSHRDGIILDTYSNIRKYVVSGDPSNSKLYEYIVRTDGDRMPPPPSTPIPTVQTNLVKKWISQGAKNNACNRCDTSVFSYATTIKPLIDASCKGCHNASLASGGIDLSTYSELKNTAISGKLLGSIRWSTGFSAMPQGAPKLPDCQITQVQKWINAGTPNN